MFCIKKISFQDICSVDPLWEITKYTVIYGSGQPYLYSTYTHTLHGTKAPLLLHTTRAHKHRLFNLCITVIENRTGMGLLLQFKVRQSTKSVTKHDCWQCWHSACGLLDMKHKYTQSYGVMEKGTWLTYTNTHTRPHALEWKHTNTHTHTSTRTRMETSWRPKMRLSMSSMRFWPLAMSRLPALTRSFSRLAATRWRARAFVSCTFFCMYVRHA